MPFITAKRLIALAVAAPLLALLAAACTSGGGEEDSGPVLTPVSARYLPQAVSSELVVGPNRFMLGLLDQEENQPVSGAQLHFRFFKLEGREATFKFEADATAVTVTKSYTHVHEDGTVEKHEAGEIGVYVANVEFDSAGDWGVEVTGTVAGEGIEPVRPIFTVLEEGLSPAVGQPVPRSHQPILGDPGYEEIAKLDTSDPPNPDMHSMTIADAAASGKPTVIVFATPAFCVSQICGPTKEVVDELYEKYKGRANFVHVEPYFIDLARENKGLCGVPVFNRQGALEQWGGKDCPSLTEADLPPPEETWNLQTEPWVFLVDSQGTIVAKYEAAVTLEELEAALTPLLVGAGG